MPMTMRIWVFHQHGETVNWHGFLYHQYALVVQVARHWLPGKVIVKNGKIISPFNYLAPYSNRPDDGMPA